MEQLIQGIFFGYFVLLILLFSLKTFFDPRLD